MKNESFGCFVILIVFAIFYFTNPDKWDHRGEVGIVLQESLSRDIDKLLNNYCAENPNEFCSSREKHSFIYELIGDVSAYMLKEQVDTFVNEEVRRENFYFFSLTKVNGKIVGVGILNMVFVSSDRIEYGFIDFLLV